MRTRFALFAVASICAALAFPQFAASSTYATFNIPSAEGPGIPTGINKWGSATGYYTTIAGPYRGFLYQSSTGAVTTFSVLATDVVGTYPTSINDTGWIVGYFDDATGMHGFLRNPKYTILDAPGAGTGIGQGTQALSINDAGEIAGVYWDSSSIEHGFVRSASGNYTTFNVPGGANVTNAVINQSGEVAGTYTVEMTTSTPYGYVMDTTGNITTVAVPSAEETYVTGINASGEVAGYYYYVGNAEPFFRDQFGNITTFNVAGYDWTAGIEDNGNVVGTYQIDDYTVFKGWQMTSSGDLTHFLDPSSGPEGTVAWCVSGNGKVAGYYFDSEYNAHNFVKLN